MTDSNPADAVVYVMTHYPKLAQTFIQGEIDALRGAGVAVHCVALNAPEPFEMARPGAPERASGTTYLKRSFGKSARALLAVTLRHPFAMARVWASAVASGGGAPARIARRVAHLAHAAQVEQMMAHHSIARVHAHFGLAPATIAWLAAAIARARRREARFSFTIHGFHDFVDPAETRLDRKVPDASAVVCISDFTRSQLFLSAEPRDWPRCHVVRCGIDLARFAYRDPPPMGQEPVIVALGRLSPEKGFAVLIEAISLLKARTGRGPIVRLIGDGPMRAALEAAASSAGLTDRIVFVGELTPEEVRVELAKADLFCLPSFSEGLPVSLMEAMAVGVPSIATWIAGIPELAENGVTALTVPPARADALAAAIERLIHDPDLRQSLARAARARVEQHHDVAQTGAEMRHLLFAEAGR